eukprot:TRINITY_DN7406_c0_g1_i3.p1 TRINITY_DN7406_c0_g1~~TRINITY_DN7406_c0_g1_i3.p1  ORF type:complete len:129 (-),score=43.14 TRINITY_DN7406_c0_g1_i3:255-641(-)
MLFFFFFKQKTAYEMQRGLVGSEMCIRDRVSTQSTWGMNEPDIQKFLKVKRNKYSICNDSIYELFLADLALSTAPQIEYLISNDVDVMLYFGDKDYICNWRGGEALVNSLKWAGAEEFLKKDFVPFQR